jgi:hypothetical protein
MSFSNTCESSVVSSIIKDMIFRVHTLKVPEIGPGFNSTSPHRRMRTDSRPRVFFGQMKRERGGVMKNVRGIELR